MIALLLLAALHATPSPTPLAEPYTHAQRLVDIGNGRKLNIYCMGSGSPTVIFDSGLETGSGTLPWAHVQPAVARFARACSYDRAGDGFSDPGPLPRDSDAVVSDLHALLDRADISPPYILVAHSIAGLYEPLFAARYPSDVAGMVLVDPSAPGQEELLSSQFPKYAAFEAQQTAALHGAPASEFESFAKDGAELNSAMDGYGAMPLIVLTSIDDIQAIQQPMGASSGQIATVQQGWIALHDRIAAQSSRGLNCVIAGSGHYIQIDKPDAVIDAVRQVIMLLTQMSANPTCPASASATPRPRTRAQKSRSSQRR